MKEIILAGQNRPKSRKSIDDDSLESVIGIVRAFPKNTIEIVANPRNRKRDSIQKEIPISQVNLIKLTEKLAEEARNGKLKGIGGFAEYEDGYDFGLEGSYLVNPESAVLPLMRLHRRIMGQIEEED